MSLGLVAVASGCGADPATDATDTALLDTADATSVEDSSPRDTLAPADAATITDSAAPDTAPGPLALSLDELCDPLAAAACQLYVGCRAATSSASVEACHQHTAATCEAAVNGARAQIASGALRYDPDAAHACLTRIGLLACAPLATMLAQVDATADCDDVFTGQLGDGAACDQASACGAGLACAPDAGAACPGTCRPAPSAGEGCDPRFSPCGAGLFCELGTCVPATVALGDACVTDAQCPDGAFCDDEEAPARCRDRLPTGAPCGDDDACADGLCCASVDFADTGNCAPRLAPDAACVPFVLGAQCPDGQTCDGELERCVDRPAKAGDACADDERPCGIAGLYCDLATSTCVPLPKLGEACGGPGASRCQYGWCDAVEGAPGVCRAFTAPAAACSHDRECGGLACVDGACGDAPETTCHPDRRGLVLGAGFRLF